jgi:hypothetical protein
MISDFNTLYNPVLTCGNSIYGGGETHTTRYMTFERYEEHHTDHTADYHSNLNKSLFKVNRFNTLNEDDEQCSGEALGT